MIRKNVDLIAIAVLLFGAAAYAEASKCARFEVNRTAGIRFSPRGPYYQPRIIRPGPPLPPVALVPPVPYTRN